MAKSDATTTICSGVHHPSADLIHAWLTARSLGRGLPAPVADRGGWRVDTASADEDCRWVFPGIMPGLREIGECETRPRRWLKLCGNPADLHAVLPPRWASQPRRHVMLRTRAPHAAPSLPRGYTLDLRQSGAVTEARVRAPDGPLAARGFAIETGAVFVYDRIETAPGHRRRGLGTAIMAALGAAQRASTAQPILIATAAGQALYHKLGWRTCASWASAVIPDRGSPPPPATGA